MTERIGKPTDGASSRQAPHTTRRGRRRARTCRRRRPRRSSARGPSGAAAARVADGSPTAGPRPLTAPSMTLTSTNVQSQHGEAHDAARMGTAVVDLVHVELVERGLVGPRHALRRCRAGSSVRRMYRPRRRCRCRRTTSASDSDHEHAARAGPGEALSCSTSKKTGCRKRVQPAALRRQADDQAEHGGRDGEDDERHAS